MDPGWYIHRDSQIGHWSCTRGSQRGSCTLEGTVRAGGTREGAAQGGV
jgi:hypothetical protein